jgi:hypothetical protein
MARMYSTEIFGGKEENPMMSETFMKAQRIMRKQHLMDREQSQIGITANESRSTLSCSL